MAAAAKPGSRRLLALVLVLHACFSSLRGQPTTALQGAASPPTHHPTILALVRSYLRAVYPAARAHVDSCGPRELIELFESLDYFYACDPSRAQLFVPAAPCAPLSPSLGVGGDPPRLPYVPRGIFYSYAPRKLKHAKSRKVWLPTQSGLEPWHQPVLHVPRADVADGAMRLFSAFAVRHGPQPSWTSVSAIVRYVWWPVGMRAADVRAVHDEQHRVGAALGVGGARRPTNATTEAPWVRPSRASWELNEPALPLPLPNGATDPLHSLAGGLAGRLQRLRELRDGDLLEVEQLGGPLLRHCPPTCGTWANIWRGTGVSMRVSAPFASLSKATAIAEMLIEIDALERAEAEHERARPSRVGPRLAEIARRLHLAQALNRTLERFPAALGGESLAATVLVTGVPAVSLCGTAGHSRLDEQAKLDAALNSTRWVQAARAGKLAPSDVVEHLLLRAPGMAADPKAYVVHWRSAICGNGAHYDIGRAAKSANNSFAWYEYSSLDGLLAVLACFLGVHTVILGAAPNDNGLLHQELVDFEAAEGSAWPKRRGVDGNSGQLDSVRQCIFPYGKRRSVPTAPELAAHWDASSKFVLAGPTAAPLVRHHASGANGPPALPPPPTLPCSLFGGDTSGWTDDATREACLFRYRWKACHIWCEGSMSQAHATIPVGSVLARDSPPLQQERRA